MAETSSNWPFTSPEFADRMDIGPVHYLKIAAIRDIVETEREKGEPLLSGQVAGGRVASVWASSVMARKKVGCLEEVSR
jgi:hypothetical protein